MSDNIHDVEAQRSRWAAYRATEGLTLAAGEDFALGGLARQADSLDLRLTFLAADPYMDAVPLSQEVMSWLKEPRPSPYGVPTRPGEIGSVPPAPPSSSTRTIGTIAAGHGISHFTATAVSKSAANSPASSETSACSRCETWSGSPGRPRHSR
jgi:hypothetical protein